MVKPLTEKERERYETIWSVPEYRETSPGERSASILGMVDTPKPGETLIDFGCGKGAGGQKLAQMYGLQITYLDLVKVEGCPDPHIQQSLWNPIPLPKGGKKWNYGFCCDVMEHFPPEFTMLAARNMLDVCERVLFIPSFISDDQGPKHTGDPLHLTVEGFIWWRDRFQELGTLLDGRDLLGRGVYYVEG